MGCLHPIRSTGFSYFITQKVRRRSFASFPSNEEAHLLGDGMAYFVSLPVKVTTDWRQRPSHGCRSGDGVLPWELFIFSSAEGVE